MKKLVVCTVSRNFENIDSVRNQERKDSCGYENTEFITHVNFENKGLPEIYNQVLDDVEGDYYIFMHDDIIFYRKNWGKEIVDLLEKHQDYSIIGIAGSSEYSTKNKKEHGAWWRYETKRYGQVVHKPNTTKAFLSMFSPLLDKDLQEVVVIDGLFMAVAKNRISSKFDERFTFDHYDTSFCIPNYLEGKYKIGVTTNIRVGHDSTGELREDWEVALNKLNDIYGDKLNIKV